MVATDYVPALLERARERAAAERLDIEFREADAEALPFADGSFDVVVSTFGVMFTPDQDRAAAELIRVCRRGGKIGLANWTPEGFIGQLFKTIGKHLPPPAGCQVACALGHARADRRAVRAACGVDQVGAAAASSSATARRSTGCTSSRPTTDRCSRPSRALEPAAQAALQRDLLALIAQFNRSGDDSMVVPSEYLEVVVARPEQRRNDA